MKKFRDWFKLIYRLFGDWIDQEWDFHKFFGARNN